MRSPTLRQLSQREKHGSAVGVGTERGKARDGGRRGGFGMLCSTLGMSCQPCHEGNSCIPVCTADLCHKAWLYEPFRDVTSQKGSWGNYLLGCSVISPGMVPPANAEGCAGHILGMAHSSAHPDKDARHWDQWEPAGLGARSEGCPKRPASTSQERDGQIRGDLLPHMLAKPNW